MTRHARAVRRSIPPLAAILLAATTVVPGCAFRTLGMQIREIDSLIPVAVDIEAPDWQGRPIVLIVLQPAPEPGMPIIVHSGRTLLEPSRIEIRMLPGTYMWGAYEDLSGDGRYQPGVEPVGIYDHLRPHVVSAEEAPPVIRLVLRPGIPAALEPIVEGEVTLDKSRMLNHEGTVTPLDDERFGAAAAKLGVWQPVDFIKKYGAGIYMLAPYQPDRTPVLFVHGMGGYPQQFAPMIRALDSARYQAWVALYPSGWRLAELSAYFDRILRGMQARLGFRRVVVVAHSMGGLISRSLVARQAAGSEPFIARLFLIASPLGGLEAAEVGTQMSPTPVPAWRDLGPRSDFVSTLFDRPVPSCTEVSLLFGYGGSSMSGASDGTVPVKSQLRWQAQLEATHQAGFDATHAGILATDRAIGFVEGVLDRPDDKLCQASPVAPVAQAPATGR